MVFIKYRERLGSDGTLPSAPIQEMLDERGNILASWRQLNRDDIQPVVEVLSKLSFLDGCSKFREVAAISRMSTGMGVLLPNRSTVRSWIARSSFDWSAGANLSNLVQEQGPTVRLFKPYDTPRGSVGKSTLLVPE